jgi:uncharacterized protein with von Willebrand factor type A (vWA) domain
VNRWPACTGSTRAGWWPPHPGAGRQRRAGHRRARAAGTGAGLAQRHTRRILWLNPLLRFDGYQPLARGAAVLHKACDGTLAVHNVTKLNELASAIAALMKQ